jgi:hypothetical protein
MFRFQLIFSCLCFVLTPSWAQNSQIRRQAEEMGEALLRKDYVAFTRFTYPKILKEMGGSPKLAASIEKQMKEMENQGVKILSLSYGVPSSVVKHHGEWQCTLPREMILTTSQGRILAKSTLIAISVDQGNNWYFIDPGERDLKTIRLSLPKLSQLIFLPSPEAPEFLGP